MNKLNTILPLLFLFFSSQAHAKLRPCYLSMSLSASKTKFTTSEPVQINVNLTNGNNRSHSILVPGNQSKGLKLIYFSWYTVDEKNFYTEVHRDSRIISMDTAVKGYVNFNRLKPKESTTVPFFFNDAKNAQKRITSNYKTPQLPPGKYKILAWYYPWDEEFSKYAFNKFDWEGNIDSTAYNEEFLDLSEAGINSPYFDVEIVAEPIPVPEKYTAECGKHCSICRAVEQEHWGVIKRKIRRDSRFVNEINLGNHLKNDTNGIWERKHRNIAYVGDTPDAILASLPSYLSREIIFQNQKGIHYFYLTWQLGKISRVGSRLNTVLYMIGLRNVRVKSSKVNYSRLKYMQKSE